MNPHELKEARHKLGLSPYQMATMLGYEGVHRAQQFRQMEFGRRPIGTAQRRLVEAYLAGYRPDDWPV